MSHPPTRYRQSRTSNTTPQSGHTFQPHDSPRPDTGSFQDTHPQIPQAQNLLRRTGLNRHKLKTSKVPGAVSCPLAGSDSCSSGICTPKGHIRTARFGTDSYSSAFLNRSRIRCNHSPFFRSGTCHGSSTARGSSRSRSRYSPPRGSMARSG